MPCLRIEAAGLQAEVAAALLQKEKASCVPLTLEHTRSCPRSFKSSWRQARLI